MYFVKQTCSLTGESLTMDICENCVRRLNIESLNDSEADSCELCDGKACDTQEGA